MFLKAQRAANTAEGGANLKNTEFKAACSSLWGSLGDTEKLEFKAKGEALQEPWDAWLKTCA